MYTLAADAYLAAYFGLGKALFRKPDDALSALPPQG